MAAILNDGGDNLLEQNLISNKSEFNSLETVGKNKLEKWDALRLLSCTENLFIWEHYFL